MPTPGHSSCGPTSNGQSKPDIVAPGNCLIPRAAGEAGYEVAGDWSSFAAPVVAGAVGLLVQEARQNPELGLAVSKTGGNCVMKAVLLD